jgi:hypothetical protein
MPRALLPLAATLALAACSSGAPNDDAAAKPAAQAVAATPRKTVIDPQLKAIQKAKAVQKTVDDQKKATEKAVDDQGG